MRKIFLVLLMVFGILFCNAQNRDPLFHDPGIYTTFDWSAREPLTITPQVWIYLKDYYLEARYNYEDIRTASLYFGKSFYVGKQTSFEIIPMIGGVVGTINGISPGFNCSLEYKIFSASSESQYTFDMRNSDNSFYWDWTNFSFGVYKNLGVGGSVQIYLPRSGDATYTAGPMINLKFKHLLLEAFSYNIWQDRPIWAFGVQYIFD